MDSACPEKDAKEISSDFDPLTKLSPTALKCSNDKSFGVVSHQLKSHIQSCFKIYFILSTQFFSVTYDWWNRVYKEHFFSFYSHLRRQCGHWSFSLHKKSLTLSQLKSRLQLPVAVSLHHQWSYSTRFLRV